MSQTARKERREVVVTPLGNLGNRMIQHMVAAALIDGLEGASIHGVGLAEWGIAHERCDLSPAELSLKGQRIDFDSARALLASPQGGTVALQAYAQRLAYFPPVEVARSIFTAPARLADVRGYGEDVLVIHIRGGDILEAVHTHYPLLPLGYYRDVIESTGLRPVFLGQLGPGEYFDTLRNAFPGAEFVPARDPMLDFTVLRRSSNIVLSVSTFAWLAAWLSEASQIHLAVNGLLNPMQLPDVDLLPFADERFRFYLFPVNYAVKPDRLAAVHASIEGRWREMPGDQVDEIRWRQPLVNELRAERLALFDEGEYLAQHPRIAEMVRSGEWPDGLTHYRTVGYAQGLSPCAFDRVWYGFTYPLAPVEVSLGDYADLFHHWCAAGRRRGYRRIP